MNIPQGYKSNDVIDRRDGQKPSVGDKIRDLGLKVVHDYKENYDKGGYYNPTDFKQTPRTKSTRKPSTGKR